VESGKRSDLPELEKTIATCKNAKLDRLSRNVPFISALMERKVDFIGCDNSTATMFTIHILAAVAEFERDAISKRTTEVAAAAKARGVTLGNYARTNLIRKLRCVARPVRDFSGQVIGTIGISGLVWRLSINMLQKRAPGPRRRRPAIGGIRLRERARGGAIFAVIPGRHVAPDPETIYKFAARFRILRSRASK
jgi:hypothetical protein